ncbi:MAG TPA: hypothetical protein DCY94_04265 [Firmicutes bacterium]|nr:hypothetical protein [Bacillota bacterium]
MNQEKIGRFIAQIRKQENMTQEELAKKLNVTDRAISNWETGRRMPDIYSLKKLCDIFSITFSELLNGEKIPEEIKTVTIENTLIKAYDKGEKDRLKLKKNSLVLSISIVIIIIMMSTTLVYFKIKYPKIDNVENIAVAPSNENSLKNYQGKDNRTIWFYAIDSVQIQTDKNNFALRDILKYDQMDLNKISDYLENNPKIEKFKIKNIGTVYKNNWYTAVVCNTTDGNRDIYFGTPDFERDLVGNYCGKNNYSVFTRTYIINDVLEDNDEEHINLVLSIFQDETASVQIKKITDFQSNKAYEFKFRTNITFEDTIKNVFDNSQIIEVCETDKGGIEQINENLFFE